MHKKCRGKEFDEYTLDEALKLNIIPIDNWRDAEKGDWIFTRDEKVLQCLGRRSVNPSNVKKKYVFIKTGYGDTGTHKSNISAFKQPDYDRDKYYFGKDLVKDVRPTAKQRAFVDNLFMNGEMDDNGMWKADSIILAYQSIYRDNNPEQSLRRGMMVLKRKHIKEYISMNMRDKLSSMGMDDDWVAEKYRDMIDGDIPPATKLNALNRVSDMLGHLAKEKKEEQIEGVFALSDGDIKKLASVRKTIAETTYGSKDSRDKKVQK